MQWLHLQLADSAFPSGAFAHSSGLEAESQQPRSLRRETELTDLVCELAWQAGYGALPFLSAAYGASSSPEAFAEVDRRADAFISNHVQNRASRTQGRALLASATIAFSLKEQPKYGCGHHAPMFGAIARLLDIAREDAQRIYLYGALRNALSAAVRLGLCGSTKAQQIQFSMGPCLDEVMAACALLGLDDAAQTAPLIEIAQMTHDRLYSRLFQS